MLKEKATPSAHGDKQEDIYWVGPRFFLKSNYFSAQK